MTGTGWQVATAVGWYQMCTSGLSDYGLRNVADVKVFRDTKTRAPLGSIAKKLDELSWNDIDIAEDAPILGAEARNILITVQATHEHDDPVGTQSTTLAFQSVKCRRDPDDGKREGTVKDLPLSVPVEPPLEWDTDHDSTHDDPE